VQQNAANDAHSLSGLSGLAAANGPWLCARLRRLGELAGLPLPMDVVEAAVHSTSRVLEQILAAEGRPAANADARLDPAVALGREQARLHQSAGLPLPDSLKVQRLLRRAYDDLVRESWVEKDSRALAHEDVERFFERSLAGLVETWVGAAPSGEDLTQLVAKREDELRRALDAAKQLSQALRQAKARIAALENALRARQTAGHASNA
jgi:hypothetical protein